MKKYQRIVLKEPIFWSKTVVHINITPEEYKKKFPDDEEGLRGAARFIFIHDKLESHLAVRPQDSRNGLLELLTHETNHITLYLLKELGIPCNEDTSEIYAYYQQYLMAGILNKIN